MSQSLLAYLPVVADFPRPGIQFRDICPLLANPEALEQALALMGALAEPWHAEQIAGVESRGLIFGAALATRLHRGLLLLRKHGKLPGETARATYALEYGQDALEIQVQTVQRGAQVLLVDDIIATGGTLLAAAELITRLGAVVAGVVALGEIGALGGRQRLEAAGYRVQSVLIL